MHSLNIVILILTDFYQQLKLAGTTWCVGEAKYIRLFVVIAHKEHIVCFMACMVTTRLGMCLAMSYDTCVHKPAFHSLKP